MKIPDYVDVSHKPFWQSFENWCANNGIEQNEIDMKSWWDCFIAGATSMYLKFKKGEIE